MRGKKHFIDHSIDSIQNFLSRDTREQYQMIDVNVYQDHIFHTKMMLKEIDLDDYLFGVGKDALSVAEQRRIHTQVRKEMLEMFYGRNISRSSGLK